MRKRSRSVRWFVGTIFAVIGAGCTQFNVEQPDAGGASSGTSNGSGQTGASGGDALGDIAGGGGQDPGAPRLDARPVGEDAPVQPTPPGAGSTGKDDGAAAGGVDASLGGGL